LANARTQSGAVAACDEKFPRPRKVHDEKISLLARAMDKGEIDLRRAGCLAGKTGGSLL